MSPATIVDDSAIAMRVERVLEFPVCVSLEIKTWNCQYLMLEFVAPFRKGDP